MKMKRSISLLAVCLTTLMTSYVAGQDRDFGQRLLECTKIKSFDDCLYDTMEYMRGFMTVGFPEFQLGPTEPLHIKNLKFASKPTFGNAVNVTASFSNVYVEGLSGFVTEIIQADLVARTLRMRIRVPRVRITGNYNARGKVILVTLEGNGPFTANLTDATGEGFGRIVTKATPTGNKLSVEGTDIDFFIPGIKIKLENLFDGKYEHLAEQTNNLLNMNSAMIIEEVKPQIKAEVTALFQSVMAKAFSELPIEDFLRQLPQQARNNRSLRNGFRPILPAANAAANAAAAAAVNTRRFVRPHPLRPQHRRAGGLPVPAFTLF